MLRHPFGLAIPGMIMAQEYFSAASRQLPHDELEGHDEPKKRHQSKDLWHAYYPVVSDRPVPAG